MEEMLRYIGVKVVLAIAMNLGDYNKHKGWKIPDDEDPARNGYLVEYSDGYQSWCPKEQFEESNRQCDAMTFGHAIEAMKKGMKVARAGWNGKGMFIYYVPADEYPASTGVAMDYYSGQVPYKAYIAMKTVDEDVVPWLASQTDMLADDWSVID
jgi:hypothetical protein